jgi:hypothetical protein
MPSAADISPDCNSRVVRQMVVAAPPELSPYFRKTMTVASCDKLPGGGEAALKQADII